MLLSSKLAHKTTNCKQNNSELIHTREEYSKNRNIQFGIYYSVCRVFGNKFPYTKICVETKRSCLECFEKLRKTGKQLVTTTSYSFNAIERQRLDYLNCFTRLHRFFVYTKIITELTLVGGSGYINKKFTIFFPCIRLTFQVENGWLLFVVQV